MASVKRQSDAELPFTGLSPTVTQVSGLSVTLWLQSKQCHYKREDLYSLMAPFVQSRSCSQCLARDMVREWMDIASSVTRVTGHHTYLPYSAAAHADMK